MKEIEMIRYLLNEIEAELKYKKEYEKAQIAAETKAETGDYYSYRWYMPEHLKRDPKKSIVQDNAKMIRRLALKIYKEV